MSGDQTPRRRALLREAQRLERNIEAGRRVGPDARGRLAQIHSDLYQMDAQLPRPRRR